jgi:hypothetical protein
MFMTPNCYGKFLAGLAIALVLLAVFSYGGVRANPIATWTIEDGSPPGWGSGIPYWELMSLLGGTDLGTYQDLDPDNAYYAYSDPMTANMDYYRVEAILWLANNYDSQNAVVVELRKGTWGNEGSLLADDTVTVSNTEPPQGYDFDFGVISSLDLSAESLILKIVYLGPGGDTHVYWDSPDCWSYMWAYGPVAAERSTWGRIKALYRE